MTPSPLALTGAVDRPTLAGELPSERIVEWTISAATAPPVGRFSLNLALVLDRSGSMAGEKLQHAKEAACRILDQLDDRDRVAVVAFDNEVLLLSPSVRVSMDAREAVKAQIRSLETDGSTDLFGGYLKGASEVANVLGPEGINRVLLLSDGQANHGTTDTEVICGHVRNLQRRGITTSTFGFGLGYNIDLLDGMAAAGEGHFYFIEHPNQIGEIFRRELGELLTAVATEVSLTFSAPKGAAIHLLGDLSPEQEGNRIRLPLGALCSGERRTFYTQILASPGKPGDSLTIQGDASYSDLGGQSGTVSAEVRFTYATAAEVKATPIDQNLSSRAAGVKLAAGAPAT